MSARRYRIPSSSALQAFEAAARHCNFSRAAAELHTSQSAISRHIANLEARFNARLFDRYRKRQLVLSRQGELLFRAVVSGLDNIQAAIDTVTASQAIINISNQTYRENLTMDNPGTTINLKGGWAVDFRSRPSITTVTGRLEIAGGNLVPESIALR